LGIVRSSEDDVKLLAGGHATVIFGTCRGSEPHAGSPRFTVIFGTCRGSEPHAGSPRFTVVVFSAGARLHAGRPELPDDGLSAVRAEIARLGIIAVRHGATCMYACVC
jgi:hypothetical protein